MVKLLFDTNILIDYLSGVEHAKIELAMPTDKAISVVTWMEVMVNVPSATEAAVKGFLSEFTRLPVDENVAVLAMKLCKRHGIKVSDAINWATAQTNSRIFVTRNTKDFSASEPGIRIPYEL
jgi:hypothetical protein